MRETDLTKEPALSGEPDLSSDPDQTRVLAADPEPTQWLAGPPPPPPAGPAGSPAPHAGRLGAPEGEKGVATHSPLSRETLRAAGGHLRVESPWMLASAGLLVLLAAYWVASIVSAFEHGHHISAQTRVLRVLAPGNFVWVVGAALAVALYAAGRRFEVPTSRPGPLRAPLALGLVLAGATAVASAALALIVELTNFGHGIAGALAGLVAYAGSLVLAAAVAWWTNLEHEDATGIR